MGVAKQTHWMRERIAAASGRGRPEVVFFVSRRPHISIVAVWGVEFWRGSGVGRGGWKKEVDSKFVDKRF